MDTAQQMTLAEAAAADLPADFKVGHIISVTGSKVTATLVSANDAAAAGELNRAVQIGSLVKMPTAESVAFGIVSALSTGNPSPSPEFGRSEEHTSELQSLMRISYAVFCLKKKTNENKHNND